MDTVRTVDTGNLGGRRPLHLPGEAPRVTSSSGPLLGLLLLLAGTAGTLASWMLAREAFLPSALRSADAEFLHLGLPDALLGVAAFPFLGLLGLAAVVGCSFPRWYWLGLNAGAFLGVLLCGRLQYEAFRRADLCPWCCLVWAATAVTFWYVTAFTARAGLLPLPRWARTLLAEYTWVPVLLHLAALGGLTWVCRTGLLTLG